MTIPAPLFELSRLDSPTPVKEDSEKHLAGIFQRRSGRFKWAFLYPTREKSSDEPRGVQPFAKTRTDLEYSSDSFLAPV